MKGIYVLIIRAAENVSVNIGALGEIAFTKGFYAYVGSAQTNLEQRVKRHLRSEKRRFWHIDYLLDNPTAKIIKIFFKKAAKAEECKTAQTIGERSKAIAGFGCSDCQCRSHLFRVDGYEFLLDSMQELSVFS